MVSPTDGWAMTLEKGLNNLEMQDVTMDGADH